MKTSWPVATFLLTAVTIQAQTPAPVTNQTALPPPTPYAIVSRDANSQVWQRTTYETDPSGKTVAHVHSYTELASGLNYLKNGKYVPSKEAIDILPDGTGVATNGQTEVWFPTDIGQSVITMETPDGRTLESQPEFLAYDDGTNTVIIGVLTNSTGELMASNQVIYPNAFVGVAAAIQYIYKKSGLEQNIVIQSQLPTPQSLGLSGSANLQVLTEFFGTNEPVQTAGPVNSRDGLRDTTLRFGRMTFIPGKAFAIGVTNGQPPSARSGLRVYKSWPHVQGRTFLVEELPFQRIQPQLEQLPASANHANVNIASADSISRKASTWRWLPPCRVLAKSGIGNLKSKIIRLAKAEFNQKPAVVLDYQTVNGGVGNYTFQADTTYFIPGSSEFDVYGTLMIEGGTVVKYGPSSSGVYVWNNPIVCRTGDYKPAIFTDMNDNSVGETISGSSGVPTGDCLGYEIYGYSTNFHDLRFEYSESALYESQASDVSDCQFINCGESIVLSYGELTVNNILFATSDGYSTIEFVDNPPPGFDNVIKATFITSTGGTFAMGDVDPGISYVYLTNSIIFGTLTNDNVGRVYKNAVALNPSGSVFQTVGGGNYYLADNSPYRNVGTTNIDPTLLADLQQKTTYPPIAYTNITIPITTTFSPQAQRDTDTPDLGYHYDPIDYAFGGCTANSNLTFTAGTAVGWFRTSSGWYHAGYGIHMADTTTAAFNGTVSAPTYWVRLTTVQEQDSSAGYGPGGISSWASGLSTAGAVNGHFLHCSMMAGDGNHFRDDSGWLIVRARDSEFNSGGIGGYTISMYFTNCLFQRTYLGQVDGNGGCEVAMRNCTMRGQLLQLIPYNPSYYSIRDCAFDGVSFQFSSYAANASYADYDYNAYTNATDPFPLGGTHDQTSVTFNWQSSWFGDFYLPSDSPLIDAGSTTADQVGLYHFTTQTNQTVEGNSTVDIGYHYVATDGYGNPLDTDGDGIPDYIEDANGNGIVDSGETDWQSATDLGLKVIITKPRNGSILP